MLDVFTDTDNYIGIVLMLVVGIVLSIPLLRVARREDRLTWSGAILLGTWLTLVALIFIADVPSRMLYWFDANYEGVVERFPFTASFMEGPMQLLGMQVPKYSVVRDIVVNTVQVIFFVIIVALCYFWGERHRKAGRFKS
jgi:hypothetical protein